MLWPPHEPLPATYHSARCRVLSRRRPERISDSVDSDKLASAAIVARVFPLDTHSAEGSAMTEDAEVFNLADGHSLFDVRGGGGSTRHYWWAVDRSC
jgi:hypothetical protein